MSHLIIAIVTLLFLGGMNYEIWKKENILRSGDQVYIDLAPADPRSLIQGDYMRLRYRLPREMLGKTKSMPRKGYLVGELDDKKIFAIKSLYSAEYQLKQNERIIQYRVRGGRLRIGSGAYFFQEGHAKHYNNARYGELRLDSTGQSILVALRDKDLNLLGPAKDREHNSK